VQNNKVDFQKKKAPTTSVTRIVIFAISMIIVFVVFLISSKAPAYSIGKDALTISSIYGQTINFSDMKNMELKSDLPAHLSKTNGSNFGTILKGHFSSDIGNAMVYINTAKPPFIYLDTASGLVILNDQSEAKTQALYQKLKAAMGQ
jgi:hypothetical protein